MKEIKLKSIFPDIDPCDYKIHFARKGKSGVEPLDAYMADTRHLESWKEWNTYVNGKRRFSRKYIFSLIYDYHEEDAWLFGGVWEIIDKDSISRTSPYNIKSVSRFAPFIGRLVIKYSYADRQRANLEDHFDGMLVKEILENTYIEHFPGYKNIDLPYETLKTIIMNSNKGNKEWKDALSIKGIYLITDTKTGKKYVGKADGERGIWQRWKSYIRNGHGGDVALRDLMERKNGISYAEKYYRFTLLEPITGEEEPIINERESYWKRVLMTRDEKFGHNRN